MVSRQCMLAIELEDIERKNLMDCWLSIKSINISPLSINCAKQYA